MWQDHPRSQRLGPDIRGMRAASGCAVLAACGEEKLWLMFKLINNSVCDRGRSSCRLGWRGGDKPRCGYVHVVTYPSLSPTESSQLLATACQNTIRFPSPFPRELLTLATWNLFGGENEILREGTEGFWNRVFEGFQGF